MIVWKRKYSYTIDDLLLMYSINTFHFILSLHFLHLETFSLLKRWSLFSPLRAINEKSRDTLLSSSGFKWFAAVAGDGEFGDNSLKNKTFDGSSQIFNKTMSITQVQSNHAYIKKRANV